MQYCQLLLFFTLSLTDFLEAKFNKNNDVLLISHGLKNSKEKAKKYIINFWLINLTLIML